MPTTTYPTETYPIESPRLRWPLVLLLAVTALAAVLMGILIAQQGPGENTSRGTTERPRSVQEPGTDRSLTAPQPTPPRP
jgi:hypothetical protein